MSAISPDTVLVGAGVAGGVVSNLTGIPFDRFRVLVAQDLSSKVPLTAHFNKTFLSLNTAFVGGEARVGMKSCAAILNLMIPQDYKREHPFSSSFLTGVIFAPALNVPRMMQLGKISNIPYTQTLRTLTTRVGFRSFMENTAVFAPGEGLRMMMCFGTKDFLMPWIGGKISVDTIEKTGTSIPMHTFKMAMLAGPIVSAVETSAAVVTETITTVQANMKLSGKKGDVMGELKKTMSGRYASRCFVSLFAKNCVANTPLFWTMFLGDYYSRKKREKRNERILK
eukprot:Pgem_evm2s16016